ncbi:MAG: molecular chaperone DnaJ [Agarilytica sp.]
MLIKLIAALAFTFILFQVYKLWKTLPHDKRRAFFIKGLVLTVFGICLIAVLTGRAHWLTAVFAGLLAAAKFGIRAFPLIKLFRGSRLFNNPKFKTAFLDVQLDMRSGLVTGQVISGPCQGTHLAALTKDDFELLEKHYQKHDKASYYLIRVVRQRSGHQYQQQQSGGHNEQTFGGSGDPSVEEAKLILGLEGQPDKEEVIKAHRSLIQKLHPDRGGNDYLASRVNLAKDILLKHIKSTED